jgi:glutaredoxin-related protein
MGDFYRQFQERPLANRLMLVVALGGSLLTLIQLLLLESGLDGICFSGGCEIVDSQTTIPPVFFNFFGLVFFQAVFWCAWAGRRSKELQFYVRILLLAGLAAEGVLVSFQYVVVEAFCTYCLIVFSLVILLNLLQGLHHAVTAAAIFVAVVVAFSTLQFKATISGSSDSGIKDLGKGAYAVLPGEANKPMTIKDLGKGAYAVLPGEANKPMTTLFFSSTCPHCEKVIKSFQQGATCTVNFNPVSKVTKFPLTTLVTNERYDVDVNKGFMKSLGQKGIPVLLVEQQKKIQLLSGGNAIMNFLDESCRLPSSSPQAK